MKRFISWIVLVFCIFFVYAVGNFVIRLLFAFLDWLNAASPGVYWFLLIIGGGIGLAILILPFALGIPIAIKTSETICLSRRGIRYLICGIVFAVSSVLNIIFLIAGTSEFSIFSIIYQCIFTLVFLLSYKANLGETWENG